MTYNAHQGPANPNIPNDADEFVRGTVDKLRLKLLDLTTRNPLISFKHGARTRRYVRVIDELPDFLFSRLDGDAGMRFRSLGRETSEPEDERTIIFRRALSAAKVEDPEFLQKLDELGDDPGEKAIERLELELRQRLREQLGMPPRKWTASTSVADVARQLNLNPSFDLPSTEAGRPMEDRHTDSAIQTMLFEDDMQLTLGRMRDVVRLSIDEAGVNPLFCVFGFLEWYEDANSATPLHAPLLLSPLSIERRLVRGQYQYLVKSTGEETQANVALIERLKRDFAIVLPPYEEDETPESYFANVQGVVDRQQGWKVRRWITVGMFSFARIAMYHDLAPERWVVMGGVESHKEMRRLIGGGGGGIGDGGQMSGDGDNFESTADGELEVPLIADADSSQVAALKDVMSGRSLVIEGPPGTGKSQTITNIIAAALAAGKSVLFLAEKMAALNVVRDRLAHAGLGDFCLELHSTKAGRKETAGALARRLNRLKEPRSAADLEAALARLKTLRDWLGRCVDALSRPAGQLGITNQELLWRCNMVRQLSQGAPSEVDELTFLGANELTEIDVGRIVATIDQFERARAIVIASYGSVLKHPWNGIARHDIDPIRAEDIVRRVRRLSEAAANAEAVFEELVSLSGVRLEKLNDMRQLANARSIERSGVAMADDIVAHMADAQTLATMEHFASGLAEYASVHTQMSSVFLDAPAVDGCDLNLLRTITDALPFGGFGDAKVGEAMALCEKRKQQAAAWRAVADFTAKLAERAHWAEVTTPAAERALVAAVEHSTLADAEILSRRQSSLLETGASAILRRGGERGQALRVQRTDLGTRFELGAPPDPATLHRHAAAIRAAPAIPFFSPAWWRARGVFLGLAKERKRIKRSDMARLLDELAEHIDASNAYAADDDLLKCVGTAFRGIDTDLQPLRRVAEWADRIRSAFPAGEKVNHHLRQFLFEGTADQIESLASLSKDSQFAVLQKVLTTGAARPQIAQDQAKVAARAADCANKIVDAAKVLRLRGDFKLVASADLARKVAGARDLREALDSSETAKSVLRGHYRGHATEKTLIDACAKHVRNVDSASLSLELRNWLLRADATTRLEALRPVAVKADESANRTEAALNDLTKIVEVTFPAWIGADSPIETRATELREHAARCANDAEGFQVLIDDVRTLREVGEVGMHPLLELLESKRAPFENLGPIAKRVVFQSMTRDAISRYPALATFSGDRHEGYRREFRELDHKLKRLRQGAIASTLLQRAVDPGVDMGSRKQWTGLALIRNEAFKQKGHTPVRDLMDRAGTAVQQLMPCFMMSPLSVAQYLKPGKIKFDIVVMDEASQLRLEDALGAIARGNQLVVVGDPMQLPPTNFFREGNRSIEDEDEQESLGDERTILKQSLEVMRSVRKLKWHYRSRHASLIAFSNKEFYGNQLVVFPSPYRNHPDYGVSYVHVPDGALKSRVNVAEAKAVAKAAVEYASKHPERSLGIVTLNQPQAELLGDVIDRLAAEDEAFAAWIQEREHSLERFFVKNLENVQGDERDTIFISTVYGPDEPGKREFAQRFGPINNQGGHRRLNVLFTRAKCQMVVFSSMDPADLRTDSTSPWGVRALKGFLKFAKDGTLDMPSESAREPDSDFELAVIGVLKAAGYDVVPQVGVVGYFIDLAIRHPKRPGEFVLGVECDGRTYHSSKSARDRDRLRQEILERLKWRIHRIWSLDWYKNPRRETERVLKAIAEAIASTE